jgi:hypothetical protein
LDAVVSTMDREVEHYHDDLATGASTAASPTALLALPPAALEVAESYRDEYVG